MPTDQTTPVNTSSTTVVTRVGVQTVRDHATLFLVEGLVLVALGVGAVFMPGIASIAATVLFGWILLISGLVGLIATLRARHAPGFVWALASACIGTLAGAFLLFQPLAGAWSLTTILIAFLFAEGIVSIFYAWQHRQAASGRWDWMLVSGAVDIALAVILLLGMPGTAVWALGTLLGVNLIFGGASLIAMALHARAS